MCMNKSNKRCARPPHRRPLKLLKVHKRTTKRDRPHVGVKRLNHNDAFSPQIHPRLNAIPVKISLVLFETQTNSPFNKECQRARLVSKTVKKEDMK